jgi:mono/diheme cytochrome c family protein
VSAGHEGDKRPTLDAVDAHCLACHGATPARGGALLGRALTVQASKLYARLHYRAELDAETSR